MLPVVSEEELRSLTLFDGELLLFWFAHCFLVSAFCHCSG